MNNYDVVVIGAGVIGTSCAYHLVEKGLKVAMFDFGDIANGTSSHCDAAAMITDKMPGPDAALGYASIQKFLKLSEKLDYDFGLIQRGSLYLCETDEEMEIASGYISDLQKEGYRVRMMNQQEMAEKEPFLAKDLPGGFWSDECCGLNPYKLCFAFTEQVKGKGLDVYTHTRVEAIGLDEKKNISYVDTNQGRFRTKSVVNAAGCWSPEIGRMTGVKIPVASRKGNIMISEATTQICHQKVQEFGYMILKFGSKAERDPELVKHGVAFTIEPSNEGHNVLVGSSRNFVDYNVDTDLEVIRVIAKRAIRFFPILKSVNFVRAYAGCRPFMPDHLPVISPVEEIPGLYIATGHEGDGISMAPMTGELIAEMVTGQKPSMDVAPYSFSRLKDRFC
ncbi:FAD-binding oxidoreductase [bacterium 1XD8-76]|nr:FAD-binding oxidoreductase [bacterium 1XD8-76]